MAQYINKSALVAEIDSLQDATMDKNRHFLSSYHEGIFDGLSKVENFLDTLKVKEVKEEPVSNDMEEAAHLYVDTTIEYFDSEGNPCCYPAFIAGAQWQKQQNAPEVKKNDLEEDVDRILEENDWNYDKIDFYEFARHFFELGLNAKGE